MSDAKAKKQTILTEDGELYDVHETAEKSPEQEAVYCIHCGSANLARASYCRKCGRSLDDQAVDPEVAIKPSGSKSKRDKADQAPSIGMRPITQEVVVLEIMTAAIMMAGVILTMNAGYVGVSIILILAWFMTVAARHGALK